MATFGAARGTQGDLRVYCPEPSTIQGVNALGIIVVQICFYPLGNRPHDVYLHSAYREILRRATAMGYAVALEPELERTLRGMNNACVEAFDQNIHGVF